MLTMDPKGSIPKKALRQCRTCGTDIIPWAPALLCCYDVRNIRFDDEDE